MYAMVIAEELKNTMPEAGAEIPDYWQDYTWNSVRGLISAVVVVVIVLAAAYACQFYSRRLEKKEDEDEVFYDPKTESVQVQDGRSEKGADNLALVDEDQ
eukprot:maker-scaffold587_size153100-snap-gene-0.24 protein:Tk01025 transcript:maker-scaffold587_size153100-snap-gene-0.24-mRNA-1 annotation:"biopolymer transporter"